MIADHSLTPDERRALGIAALTALATGIVGGAVSWAFEEAKRVVNERREARKEDPHK